MGRDIWKEHFKVFYIQGGKTLIRTKGAPSSLIAGPSPDAVLYVRVDLAGRQLHGGHPLLHEVQSDAHRIVDGSERRFQETGDPASDGAGELHARAHPVLHVAQYRRDRFVGASRGRVRAAERRRYRGEHRQTQQTTRAHHATRVRAVRARGRDARRGGIARAAHDAQLLRNKRWM